MVIILAMSCLVPMSTPSGALAEDDPIKVVATTTQIADLARNIGGEHVSVVGIMQPGVDPHLYRASESDLRTMLDAEVIFYNGLNLEGQMSDALVQLASGRAVVSLGAAIPEDQRLEVADFPGESDPHIWFDPGHWMLAAQTVADTLIEVDPDRADAYQANAEAYIVELEALDSEVAEALSVIPESQRLLVTAHDAFGYFGARYGFEVIGIQGLSTETEAGIADLQRVVDIIVEREIPAIFVETTISPSTIEAVQAAVADRGGEVVIGGQLYSDAMGEEGTPEGTYLGMYRHNVAVIVATYVGDDGATPTGS